MPGFWGGDQGSSLFILVLVLGCCRGGALVDTEHLPGAGGAVKSQGRAGVNQGSPLVFLKGSGSTMG